MKRNLIKVDCGCGNNKIDEECIGVDVRKTDATNLIAHGLFLPFKTKSIDILFAKFLLEHFDNPYGFLDEAQRILRPNGVMMVWVPNSGTCSAHLVQQHPAGHKFLGDYHVWKRILDDFFESVKGIGLGVKFRSCPNYFKRIQQILVRIGFYDLAYDLFFICKHPRDESLCNFSIWWSNKAEIDKDAYSTLRKIAKEVMN